MRKSIFNFIIAGIMMVTLLAGCSSKSSSSSNAGGAGKCQYKEGGRYVCSKSATYGDLCKDHYEYLNDTYNSLLGN